MSIAPCAVLPSAHIFRARRFYPVCVPSSSSPVTAARHRFRGGSMISRAFKTFLLGALLVLPLTAYAQEATLSGTIVDSTNSVLPGVTVTAVHQATGNRFVGVTDGRGLFRLPVRIGDYVVPAELQGFTPLPRAAFPC